MEPSTLRVPTRWQYFRTFAGCHFMISVLGVAGVMLCFGASMLLEGYLIFMLILWDVVLMALYAVMGGWAAGEMSWSSPKRFRDGLGAFLAPALVAWIWGGAFVLLTSYYGGWEAAGYEMVTRILFWSLLIFAFPSSWGYAILSGLLGYHAVDDVTSMLIVGALPPLLFLLGSIWSSRRQEKKLLPTNE